MGYFMEKSIDGSEERRLILLRLQNEKGLSNQELAKRSGLAEQSISRYRNGKSLLNDVETLEKLAHGLDVSICEFFPREKPQITKHEMFMAFMTFLQHYGNEGTKTINHLAEMIEKPPGEVQPKNPPINFHPAAIKQPIKRK
jgi:transcriptional regulator with XRE-family HTH domain